MNIKLIAKIFLGLMGLAFIKVGIETTINPTEVLANVGIELTNTSALSSMRAVYGGMHFIFGAFCLFSIFKRPEYALGLVTLYTTGFVLGRLSGIIIDGQPNQFVLTWLITEMISLLVAVFLLIQLPSKVILQRSH